MEDKEEPGTFNSYRLTLPYPHSSCDQALSIISDIHPQDQALSIISDFHPQDQALSIISDIHPQDQALSIISDFHPQDQTLSIISDIHRALHTGPKALSHFLEPL
ncbi:hypothetical protein STEG23_018888 [Scotinomys teguina]